MSAAVVVMSKCGPALWSQRRHHVVGRGNPSGGGHATPTPPNIISSAKNTSIDSFYVKAGATWQR